MNLIEGTRSAWAAACRRALVANILTVWESARVGVCVGVWTAFSRVLSFWTIDRRELVITS